MNNISEYIASGIIESYVLGLATPDEIKEVENMSANHPEIREAIVRFSETVEQQSMANAIAPDPIIKPMVMATVDFIGRMEKGETPSFPPVLNEQSTVADYAEWLERDDMMLTADFDNIYAKIIGFTPETTTVIVWIKEIAPQEVHNDEYEKFLIVEGTCNIIIEEKVYSLVPGDYLAIPLHKKHFVEVTSNVCCKAIMQRVAA